MPQTYDFRYTQIADDLAQLSEMDSVGNAVHMYVAGRKGSAMLIDNGFPNFGPQVIAALEKAGWTAGDFRYLLLTHEHWDHYGATAELRTWAKDAKVVSHIYCGWVLSQRWTRFIEPGWHPADSGFQYGEPSRENFARFESNQPPPTKIDQIIWNEQTLEVGGAAWRIWHVPGHCQGQILLYREGDKATIVGDLIQGCTESGRWLGLLTDVRSQRENLQKLKDLKPSLVAMGHHSILRGAAINTEIDCALGRIDAIMDVVRKGLKAGANKPDRLAMLACKQILDWQPDEAPWQMIVTMKAVLAQLCQEGLARLVRTDEWQWAR